MSNEEILDKNQQDAAVEGDILSSEEVTEEALEAVNETEGEAFSPEEMIERLEQAEKKASENWDQLLRTKAEMDNIRRRTQKDLENAHKFALEKFISEMLAVKDSLEMGVDAAGQENANVENLREGSEMTLNMLSGVFEKFNVVELNPMGEKFNADHHQAMSMQPSDEHEPNTVMAVMQKGYLLNDRLVRPAMVMVSKAAD
ncbi:MAG: nucleotide exchange factor GrpE [endosymbiont of Galathealinum brachiosum]|uniref:Protein GrpE n=1 Tax=endosymbiont of Galathealinum brachiosum TaxID=2200906 RepID=A0A370DMI5_9GAMM|nr:MAG: nucleotide exchange factor GrpE [endosymbiont of Galathealinum brachiosum]